MSSRPPAPRPTLEDRPRKRWVQPVLVVAILAIAAIGAWLAWGWTHTSSPAVVAAKAKAKGGGGRRGGFDPDRVQPVTAVRAKLGDIDIVQTALGTVTAARTATVRPRVDGLLQNIAFTDGQTVKSGQVLAEIDPAPFQVALEQVEGQLARDQAQLANAKVDLGRYQALLKQDSIAGQQVDQQAALVKQPSTLLERRPDVAAAERRMAASNARIGVAEAAYFPSLNLTANGGFAGSALANLVSAPNRIWSLGLAAAATLLDFGARSADVAFARAAYDEAVANYRQTSLQAFQEVEDDLAALHWLAEEATVQQQAARAARESVALTLNQYKAGTVSYLNVTVVQASQLSEERSTVAILERRLAASVALIRALGGTWEAAT